MQATVTPLRRGPTSVRALAALRGGGFAAVLPDLDRGEPGAGMAWKLDIRDDAVHVVARAKCHSPRDVAGLPDGHAVVAASSCVRSLRWGEPTAKV